MFDFEERGGAFKSIVNSFQDNMGRRPPDYTLFVLISCWCCSAL